MINKETYTLIRPIGSAERGEIYVRGLYDTPEYYRDNTKNSKRKDFWWRKDSKIGDNQFLHTESIEDQRTGEDLRREKRAKIERTMIVDVDHDTVKDTYNITISSEFWEEFQRIFQDGIIASGNDTIVEWKHNEK